MIARVGPVRHLVFRYDPSLGPELRVVIAGIVAKFLPFAIGHLEFGDVERVELDDMYGTLPRVAVAEVVTHAKGPRRYVDVIAVAITDRPIRRRTHRQHRNGHNYHHPQQRAHVTSLRAGIRLPSENAPAAASNRRSYSSRIRRRIHAGPSGRHGFRRWRP